MSVRIRACLVNMNKRMMRTWWNSLLCLMMMMMMMMMMIQIQLQRPAAVVLVVNDFCKCDDGD